MDKNVFVLLILALTSLFISSCNENEKDDSSNVMIYFNHEVDGQEIKMDTLLYVNAAGNEYMVNELQYFISDLTLYFNDGRRVIMDNNYGIHYVDSDISSTLFWNVSKSFPAGYCDSITFIFGIKGDLNQNGLFLDPPESLMFWPDALGGGYHYMKMNGKWMDQNQQLSPFNFHLGIGQIYDNQGNITEFVQNFFKVSMNAGFEINPGPGNYITINMDVESWFETPNTWDFNFWGGMIMQNQVAMQTACENGKDAFSVGITHDDR